MSAKYTFYCLNRECEETTLIVVECEESQTQNQCCSTCGHTLKHVGQKMFGGYAKVMSGSPEQRKQVIKDRAYKHFKREIEPVKKQMLKDAGIRE